jgi:tape measure domain-containing protein
VADLNRTVSIIFTGEDRASAAAAQVEAKIGGIGREAGGAQGKVAALDGELQQLASNDRRIQAVVAGLQALAASLVLREFIDANVQVEQFQRTLTLVTGSSQQAKAEFEFVRDVAGRLGLAVRDVGGAYANLAAATNGTNLQGQQTRDIFEAVSRAMGALGRSSADTQGAFLAITQIVSKGRVSLEELNGQLGERLPGALQIAARGLGVTTEELIKLVENGQLTATQFLPAFARALNATFAGATFDGYQASLNRLRNAIDDAFVTLGDTGAFDVLTKGLQLGTAAIVGAIGTLTLLGEVAAAVFAKLQLGDSFNFGAAVEESFNKAANSMRRASEAVLGVNQGTDATAASAIKAGNELAGAFERGKLSAKELEAAAREVDKSLKALGIDPKTFLDPIKELDKAFTDLAKNPAASGDQIVTGLIGALRSLPQEANLDELRRQLAFAFRDGRISAEEYAQGLALIETKARGLSPSFGPVTDAVRRQGEESDKAAKAAERATEKAQQYRLELEKLASNERIKNIEARVSIRTAELEAQTKQVQAAFESINATVADTGKSLQSLFGLFSKNDISFSQLRKIEDQIDKENQRRDDALKLQRELVQAQIAQFRAQTQALERGDSLIKIDGAGLQPHLEAFMWEILRTIQVRVNRDGLKLLLGT